MLSVDFGSAQSPFGNSPPLLLPAPLAAGFSTSPDLDFGRLCHVTLRIPRLSASKEDLSAAAQEAAEAKFGDQLDALVPP